MRSTH